MDRAAIILNEFAFFIKTFTAHTIPAFVVRLIDITGVVDSLKELLRCCLMTFAGSADEIIVLNIKIFPQ